VGQRNLRKRVEPNHVDLPRPTLRHGLLRVLAAAYIVLLMLLPRFVTVLTLAVSAGVLLLLWVNQFVLRKPLALRWIDCSALTGAFAILAGVLTLGCTWAHNPTEALLLVLFFSAAAAVVFALSNQASSWHPDFREAILQGLVIGMVIGAIYIALEMATGRELQRLAYNIFPQLKAGFEKHLRLGPDGEVLHVSDAAINRTTFVFSTLFWPTMLVLWNDRLSGWKMAAAGLLVATAAGIVLISTHQSSQLAIAASSVMLLVATISLRGARILLATGITALFVLIIPFSHYAGEYGYQVNTSVPPTMRARLIYWSYTTDRIFEKPWFGVGINSTPALHQARGVDRLEKPPGYLKVPGTGVHPHNIYLQLWYEAGVFGVTAALICVFLLIARMKQFTPNQQPFALAFITLISLLTMASYGLWQTWFQCTVALAAFAFVLATLHGTDAPAEP
jgi:O-antigen ligase